MAIKDLVPYEPALEAASQNLEIKLMDSSTIHVIDCSIFNYPLTNIK
jgi:hypothetical protein